jgi:hypothetical protein
MPHPILVLSSNYKVLFTNNSFNHTFKAHLSKLSSDIEILDLISIEDEAITDTLGTFQ